MKRMLIVLCAGLFFGLVAAQRRLPGAEVVSLVVGRAVADSGAIHAMCYTFPAYVRHWALDSASTTVVIESREVDRKVTRYRGPSIIGAYDLTTGRCKWTKPVAGTHVDLNDELIMQVDYKRRRTSCFNAGDGSLRWSVDDLLYEFDHDRKVGIGALDKGGKYDAWTGQRMSPPGYVFSAYDLSDGRRIWTLEVPVCYEWRWFPVADDSLQILGASGLRAFDPRTGRGWEYEAQTFREDYPLASALMYAESDRARRAREYLSSHPAVASPSGNALVLGLWADHILVDSVSVYYASRDELIRLDHAGQPVWRAPLPPDMTATSDLWMADSLLLMVNYGYARTVYGRTGYGRPYIAAYSPYDGRQRYMKMVSTEIDPIREYYFTGDTLCAITNHKAAKYFLESGETMASRELDTTGMGALDFIINRRAYVPSEDSSRFIPLAESDPEKLFLCTNRSKIVTLDDGLHVEQVRDMRDLYLLVDKSDDHRIVCKGDTAMLLDYRGVPVARFAASSGLVRVGTQVYDLEGDRLTIIDLSRFLTPDPGKRLPEEIPELPDEIAGMFPCRPSGRVNDAWRALWPAWVCRII